MVILKFIFIAGALLSADAYAGFQHPFTEEALQTVAPAPAVTTNNLVKTNPVASAPTLPVARKPASLPTFDLHGLNREEVRRFAKEARDQKLPTREYSTLVRAAAIQEKYAAALHPTPHTSVRSLLKIASPLLSKIFNPENETPFLWQTRRFDALFEILNKHHHFALSELWWLGTQKASPRPKRYRDFLFAGIAAARVGFPFSAYYLFSNSLATGIEESPYYLTLLWNQGEELPNFARRQLVAAHKTRSWTKLDHRSSWGPMLVAMAETGPQKDWPMIQSFIKSSDSLEQLKLLIAQRQQSAEQLQTLSQSHDQKVADWAHLQLARLRAANAQWPEAIEHYHAIKDRETEKLSLLTEEAFIETRLGNWKQALGKSIGLQSDFFRYGFAPEVYLLESVSRKALCDYGGAEAAVTKLNQAYGSEIKELQDFLAIKDNRVKYEAAIAKAQQTGASRYSRYLVHLPEIQSTHRLSNEWWQEEQRVKAFPSAPYEHADNLETWKAYVASFEIARKKEQDLNYATGGRLMDFEAHKLLAKAQKIIEQSELLLLDVAAKASGEIHLQNALNFPVRAPAAEAELPENKNDWTYKQEVWEDEVESLQSVRGSRCVQDQRE